MNNGCDLASLSGFLEAVESTALVGVPQLKILAACGFTLVLGEILLDLLRRLPALETYLGNERNVNNAKKLSLLRLRHQ